MLSVPSNNDVGPYDKHTMRSLFKRKSKNKRSVSTLNFSQNNLSCSNGKDGFVRSASGVLHNTSNGSAAQAPQPPQLSKSRSLLNVLRHRLRSGDDTETKPHNERPNLISRILAKNRSLVVQHSAQETNVAVEQQCEEVPQPPVDTINEKYEQIKSKYNIRLPNKSDEELSRTRQSTVKIACLLNGYTAVGNKPLEKSGQHQNAKHFFDFEPFYTLAARRASQGRQMEVEKKSANDKCTECNQLALIADSFNGSMVNAIDDLQIATKDGHSFRLKVDQVADELEQKCQEYESLLADADIPEEARGSIQSAIGQTRLLQNKKINQFRKLCSDNVNGVINEGDKETTNEDLAGFWDMLTIQVDKCRSTFSNLDEQRKSGWTAPLPAPPKRTVRKASPKPVKPNTSKSSAPSSNQLRELIRQQRKKLQNGQQICNGGGGEDLSSDDNAARHIEDL